MASKDNQTGRGHPGLVLAVLGAWVAVVIVGAGKRGDDSLLGVDHLDIVWVVVLAIGALLGLVLLIVLNPFASEWKQPEKPRRGGIWAGLLLVLVLLLWKPEIVERFAAEDDVQVAGEVVASDNVGDAGEVAVETVAQATDVLLLLMAIGAVGALWYVLNRRHAMTEPVDQGESDQGFEAELAATIDRLMIALNNNSDPRTAVMQSYALLESVLASYGPIRAVHETPTEHLQRSLRTLRIDAAPLIQLGRLYEVARFSDHEITVDQKLDAARSLQSARTALASLA